MDAIQTTKRHPQYVPATLDGDVIRYMEMIHPYMGCIYHLDLACLQNTITAEELAIDTFVEAFRQLSRFQTEAALLQWIVHFTLREASFRVNPPVGLSGIHAA